jgi:hypothetical protein
MEVKLEKKSGRYVVYERGLLHSYRNVLRDGIAYGESDDPAEAMGLLDGVLAFGLSGFVYDTERDAVRDPLRSEGWVEL